MSTKRLALGTFVYFGHNMQLHTTSFPFLTLQLRIMASPAQKCRSSGRISKKTFKVRENDAFTPIAIVPPPKIVKGLFSLPHPAFEPLKRVPFDSIHVLVPIVSALQLFLLLLGEESLITMVITINNNAEKEWH